MLLLGKGLGNGLHLAAILMKERPEKEALYAVSGGSGDDPLACAAACQVFEELENGLLVHIGEVGTILNQGLKELENSPLVLECRGIGLAAAMEFLDKANCTRAVTMLEEQGYIVGQSEHVLYLKPPYVITEEQIRGFLSTLATILKKCEKEKGE